MSWKRLCECENSETSVCMYCDNVVINIIVKMQNIYNLIGWNSVHFLIFFDIFNCFRTNINGMWNVWKARGDIQNIWIYTNLNHLFAGGGGGPQKDHPSLRSVTHILQWWNLAQLYLNQRRSKIYMNHVAHPLSFDDISIFSQETNKFCYIKKYRYRLYFDS